MVPLLVTAPLRVAEPPLTLRLEPVPMPSVLENSAVPPLTVMVPLLVTAPLRVAEPPLTVIAPLLVTVPLSVLTPAEISNSAPVLQVRFDDELAEL